MKNVLMTFTCILALVLAAGTTLAAGTLDAPAAPTAPGSAMYTGQDLYIRLTTGAAGALRSGAFVEPLSGPAPSGPTLNDIMAAMPAADNANGATVSNVLGGKTFWGLRTDGTWGLNTGSVPVGATNVPGNNGALAITIPNGLYSGSTTATASDTNLVSGNIRAGVPIFGVTGATAVVDTSSGTAAASDLVSGKIAYVAGATITGTRPTIPVPKSGQTTFYATGDDGNLQKGYAFPTPRFTDNGNGTVTDNATGLIWLKNANCPGEITWTTALNWSNTLANGSCGLSDGSTAGQWRLPNLRELQSLVVYNGNSPAVPSGNPFANVLANDYWVSTTYAYSTSNAWVVELYDGSQHEDVKTDTNNVWPVRGGQ